MEKDWRDDIMESTRGIKRAEPNPFLFTRIEANINAERYDRVFTFRIKFAGGLCVLVLIMNTIILLKDLRSVVTESQKINSEYQLSKPNYQLY